MNQRLSKVLECYSQEEIIQICKKLNRSYNIYDPDEVRWDKISYAFFRTSSEDINNLKMQMISNEVVNDLIFTNYICERVVKYHFIKKLMNLGNHIVAFEMTIADSRIDICRINGASYAYEIKTQYDSFDRLNSQMHDYIKAFEKVYVVVPKDRIIDVKDHIPPSCGIISYRMDKKSNNLIFSYAKKAIKNACSPAICIGSLSSNDMSQMLKILEMQDCRTREEKLNALLEFSKKHSIWPTYRAFLRSKYLSQWSFLEKHFDEILPIDVQNFFSSNIDPMLFYQR